MKHTIAVILFNAAGWSIVAVRPIESVENDEGIKMKPLFVSIPVLFTVTVYNLTSHSVFYLKHKTMIRLSQSIRVAIPAVMCNDERFARMPCAVIVYIFLILLKHKPAPSDPKLLHIEKKIGMHSDRARTKQRSNERKNEALS